ncbi:hypothetical protein ACHAWF_000768 [Thalassiosira exigua]
MPLHRRLLNRCCHTAHGRCYARSLPRNASAAATANPSAGPFSCRHRRCHILAPMGLGGGGAVDVPWRRIDKRDVSRTERKRRMSSDTYYDSQSGRHVPVHDETKIAAYLRCGAGFRECLTTAGASGMAGVIVKLPQKSTENEEDGISALLRSLASNMGNEKSTIFSRLPPAALRNNPLETVPANINLCFEYEEGEDIHATIAASGLRDFSIGIFDPTYYRDEDPITVASRVANAIDASAEGGGGSYVSNILLDPDAASGKIEGDFDPDDLVRLCEELSYLDVTGPTVKSRMVVAAVNKDQLEECLGMGISKFIVGDNEGRSLDMLMNAVEEQGKELVLDV